MKVKKKSKALAILMSLAMVFTMMPMMPGTAYAAPQMSADPAVPPAEQDTDQPAEGTHEHDWVEGEENPPTCTEPGSITYGCECGETKTEEIPAPGHEWGKDDGADPVTCQVCGEEKSETAAKEENAPAGKDEKTRAGKTDKKSGAKAGDDAILSMTSEDGWPAEQDTTYVMADANEKRYRIDYKRKSPQNKVLVVETLDFGSTYTSLPTDGDEIIAEAKDLDDHRFAVRLKNGGNDIGSYFTFSIKHVALSADEAAKMIDGYNTGGADTRLAVKEYNLDPEAPLETVLTAGNDEDCAKKVTIWEGKPYYKNYGKDEHPIDIKNPETDLYKVDVTPLSTSAAPMTDYMLNRIGYYNNNTAGSFVGRCAGEPRLRLTEAYQKTRDDDGNIVLDGSLMEIEKIRLYAPSDKMKLRAIGNTSTSGSLGLGNGRVLDGSDFTEQWGGWVIDKGQDGKGYPDPNKRVTVTGPNGTTTEEPARYYDVTPPSRWFNRESVRLNEFLGGMVTHWNLMDADDPLEEDTKYIVHEGMIVYYRLPGDTTARQVKFDGPEVKTYKVRNRTATRSNNNIKRNWNSDSDEQHNVVVGSIQRNERLYDFYNVSYSSTWSNGVHYLPQDLGQVTQTYTFPYQIQPAHMDLDGYTRSSIFGSLPGSELASVKYTCHGSNTVHEVDKTVINKINDALSKPDGHNKYIGGVSFGQNVHVETLTLTWKRLGGEAWPLQTHHSYHNSLSESVIFTYRVNDWKDENEEEKLDLNNLEDRWVQVKYEEDFSKTDVSPDYKPPVVAPPRGSERGNMGNREQGFWFRLIPPICPDLTVAGNGTARERNIHAGLDNGNTTIGQLGFEVGDYGQRRDTIKNPTIQIGLTWENQWANNVPKLARLFGTGAYEKCGLDGIELSDMLFFLNGSFRAGDKLFNTKENKGWTFTYDVFNGETKENYKKTYVVKAEDIGQTVNLLEENEYFTSLSLSYDGAADVSHANESDTEKVKWLMSDIGFRRLNTNPRDGKPISVSKDFCASILSLMAEVNFEDCTCYDHKHCSKTDHTSHLGTAKWQKAKPYLPYGEVGGPSWALEVVYKSRKGSVNVTGSLETTDLQSIRQGGSATASFNFREECTTVAPYWDSNGDVLPGRVFQTDNGLHHYPWGEIHEAVYIELTDPEFVPDLENTTFCDQSCDPAKGKVISETVITADGKTFLKLRLADGVKRQDVVNGSRVQNGVAAFVTENLKLTFKSLPATSKGRHDLVGDIYFDAAGLLDHYRAGDKDSEGNRITTGYDGERTKYVFSGAVADPYEGTTDALSPWTAEGIADQKLFKYDGSDFKVDVEVAQSTGASLAPGKNYGSYETGTAQPRTLTFNPGEENSLNGLMTLIGPSPNDFAIHDVEAYVTLPRIGTDIAWSAYETQNGEPVLVDQEPQANEELSLYLRDQATVLDNTHSLDHTVTYTTGTPGIGATYVTADKITDWRAVTGIKVCVKECPAETALQVRLNLECDAKGNTDVLTAYGGGEYRYKETANGRFKEPQKLHLCAWEYGNDENMLTLEAEGCEDVYDGEAHMGSVTASDTEGTTIEYSTDGGKTWSEDEPSITDVGEISVTVRATNPNYNNKPRTTYTLKVTPAPLTIETASAEKKYDGQPLTKTDGYTLDGLVKNETVAFAVTGSRTEVGESDNTYSLAWTGTAKESNYTVGKTLGKLKVTKNDTEITLTAASAEKTYDGKALTNDGVTAKGLPNGFTVKATMTKESTITDVGTQANVIGSYVIKDVNGEDVTGNFTNVRKVDGELKVNPKDVTVTANDKTKKYGDEDPEFDTTVTGMVDGDTYKLVYSLTREAGEDAGKYPITASGEELQGNYKVEYKPGTLTIEKLGTLGVRATGYDGKYDGAEHKSFISVSDEKGTTLTYSTDGGKTWTDKEPSIKDVGEISAIVKATNKNYDNEPTAPYTLTVTPAPLTIVTASAEKKYDGQPLTKTDGYTLDGLVKNETVAFAVTGSQTEVGESDNTYSLAWTGTAKESNYTVGKTLGKLKVTKNDTEITLTAASDKRVYNGQPLTNDGVTAKGLPSGFTVKATMTKESTVTDVGTQPNEIKSYVITVAAKKAGGKKAPGDDVTDWFTNVKTVKGQLEVMPATLTIETASATKEYDSTPLTKTDDYIFKGLAGKETVSFKVTGSRTDVGESDNTYEITWDGSAKAGNYTITDKLGKLVVTANGTTAITLTAASDEKVFDGTPLKNSGVTAKGLPDGFTVTATMTDESTITNKGTKPNVINSYVIRDKAGKDVTEWFKNVTKVNGELKVNPKDVTVTANDKTKPFGSADPEFDATVSGMVAGDEYELVYSLTRKPGESVGSYPITADGEKEQGNYNVTYNPGTLIINKADTLGVSATDYSGVYDGATHEGTVSVSDAEGTTIEYSTDGGKTWSAEAPAIKDVGTVNVTVKATNPSYSNIPTANYQLIVTPAPLTVKTASATKTYDKTPLTKTDEYTFRGLVSDGTETETASFAVTGSQTEAGKSDNTYEITWDGTAKESNYTVQETLGELEVLAVKSEVTVIITGKTDSLTYDGQEHAVSGYDVEIVGSDLYTEDDFTFSGKAEAKGTDVAVYPMGLAEDQFANTNGNFTNVTFLVRDGQLAITPLTVTVKITGYTKIVSYNGMEQIVSGYDTVIDNALYTEADFTFTGKAEARGIEQGLYPMGLTAQQFVNTNSNFEAIFIVEDGCLEITRTKPQGEEEEEDTPKKKQKENEGDDSGSSDVSGGGTRTGDSSPLILGIILMLAAIAAAGGIVIRRRIRSR